MARILVVRTLAQGTDLKMRLEKLGHEVDICEIAKVEDVKFSHAELVSASQTIGTQDPSSRGALAPWDPGRDSGDILSLSALDSMSAQRPPLNDEAILIFTSQNAVESFAKQSDLRNVRALAVGAKTAATLKDRGFTDVTITGEDVDDLLEYVKTNISKDSYIYYICGEIITKEAAQELQKLGYKAEKIIVYRMVYADKLESFVKNEIYDFVMLFSQYTAQNFVRLIIENNCQDNFVNSVAITISEKVANAAKKITWQDIKISAKKDSDSMTQLII